MPLGCSHSPGTSCNANVRLGRKSLLKCGSCPAARRLVCIFTLPSVPCQRLTDLRHVYEHNRQADPSPLLTRLGTIPWLALRNDRLLSNAMKADATPSLRPRSTRSCLLLNEIRSVYRRNRARGLERIIASSDPRRGLLSSVRSLFVFQALTRCARS